MSRLPGSRVGFLLAVFLVRPALGAESLELRGAADVLRSSSLALVRDAVEEGVELWRKIGGHFDPFGDCSEGDCSALQVAEPKVSGPQVAAEPIGSASAD